MKQTLLAKLSNAALGDSGEGGKGRFKETARQVIENAERAIWHGQTIDDAIRFLEGRIDALSRSLEEAEAAELRRALVAELNRLINHQSGEDL